MGRGFLVETPLVEFTDDSGDHQAALTQLVFVGRSIFLLLVADQAGVEADLDSSNEAGGVADLDAAATWDENDAIGTADI